MNLSLSRLVRTREWTASRHIIKQTTSNKRHNFAIEASSRSQYKFINLLCLFVVTPPFPRDEGTARTAIQVHAVNLITIKLGERWQPISNQS